MHKFYDDESQTLETGLNAFIRALKMPSPQKVTSAPAAHAELALICEQDEQWSFMGKKTQQHWLWYANGTKHGGVPAYTFASRTDKTCANCWRFSRPSVSAS